MPVIHRDVLVVGGGPAGSVTAHHLAVAGHSVLLADKATFPRDKPCGGGVTMRAARVCPVDLTPVVEDRIDAFELRHRFGRPVTRPMRGPVILMTQRARLDAFLLDAAREAGVDVREGATVSLGESIRIDGEPVSVDAVVGADGANGSSARALGLGGSIRHGVAYEGNVALDAAGMERYRGRALIELGSVPGGYGWVFPKADHVNVGVGAWEDQGPRMKEHLRAVCAGYGIDPGSVTQARGHRLPLRRAGTVVAGGRALLVGDAAGLIDPVSGDGMYECFISAELAARAVSDLLAGREATLLPYAAALDRRLGQFHAYSWAIKNALDRWPAVSWPAARSRLVWRTVEKLLTGEIAHPGEQGGAGRIPMRTLTLLGRPTERPPV